MDTHGMIDLIAAGIMLAIFFVVRYAWSRRKQGPRRSVQLLRTERAGKLRAYERTWGRK